MSENLQAYIDRFEIFAENDNTESRTAPNSFVVLPKSFSAKDAGTFKVDEISATAIMDEMKAGGNDLVIDYEHASLFMGNEAPAAGWIKSLKYDKERGLIANVEWVEKAKAQIEAKEYKYFSPVFFAQPASGRVLYLESVGLTNTPRMNDLPELLDAASSKKLAALSAKLQEKHDMADKDTPKDDPKEIIKKLEAELSDAKIVAKLVCSSLGLGEEFDPKKFEAKVLALKNPGDKVNKEEYDKLQTELTALSSKVAKTEEDSAIIELKAENKITTEEEETLARKMFSTSREVFDEWRQTLSAKTKTGVTTPPSDDKDKGSNSREKIILAAKKEHDELGSKVVCSMESRINYDLKEAKQTPLTDEEKAKYEVVAA